MRSLRARRLNRGVAAIFAVVIGLMYLSFRGMVRARHNFEENGRTYTVVVRERSNETPLLDWLMNIAGYTGFHHPGCYSYRADLYEGRKKIATTGWSGGSEQYHENSIEVLSANQERVEMGYGGPDNTSEDTWKYLQRNSFGL